ncbi:MAG: hypothetical protein H0X41_11095, partial [Chitinophagaceae bacterium]|nr:hypothetical protein [Chitinophagaceae bacterium]
MKPIKKAFALILISLSFIKAYSQNCVDYDVSSYPKTINGDSYPWDGAHWNIPTIVESKRTNLDFGNHFFKGLLEYLPGGYDPANTSVKYPLIIFFHGGGSMGNGTAADLCRLFKDKGSDMATHLSIPGRVERQTALFTQSYLGDTYHYMVISPQFNKYTRNYAADGTPAAGNAFPSAFEVEKVIDYLVDTMYVNKVDKRRIYLVGYSNGANMIAEYAGSSVERAKRVAAIMPISLCSQLNHSSNAAISTENIAAAKLKTWFVYCTVDNCGFGPALNVPQAWVTGIKDAGGEPPRLTVLVRNGNDIHAHLQGLYNCSDTLAHDSWSRAFDPNFTASFEGNGATTNVNDGINLNMYQWFTQQISAVLPVTLKSFTARLINKNVELNWTTTDEKDNALFTIERSGTDQKFIEIGTLSGAREHAGEKNYSFSDISPLTGLGFYRLVQTDIDGRKTYLQIKKILNRQNNDHDALVYPNPFSSGISVFVSLQRSQ